MEAAVKQNKQTWGHQAEREVAEWLSTPFSGHWCRLHLVSPCLSLVSAFGWEGPMVRMTSWHLETTKCWPLLKDLDPRGCSTGLCRCAVTLVSNHCCYKPSSAWVVWVSQGSSKSWKDVGKVCQILSSWLEDIVYFLCKWMPFSWLHPGGCSGLRLLGLSSILNALQISTPSAVTCRNLDMKQ